MQLIIKSENNISLKNKKTFKKYRNIIFTLYFKILVIAYSNNKLSISRLFNFYTIYLTL